VKDSLSLNHQKGYAMRLTLVLWTFVSLASAGLGATIYVPDDQPTIQDAIDAANQSGDEIIVRPGFYVENIDFDGKAVAIRSEQGPTVTQIHGGGPSANREVVNFTKGEGPGSIIDGFALINGFGDNGGGIRCVASSPTIINNVISQCHSNFLGGGIFCQDASPRIAANRIIGNTSGSGGGIYCDNSSPPIYNNTISENSSNAGGGIFCENGSTPTMRGNVIFDNLAHGPSCYGGAVVLFDSSVLLVDNMIKQNRAHHSSPTGVSMGGGIFCAGMSTPSLSDNQISYNEAYTAGGGLFCDAGATPLVTGNAIHDNRADEGGGIHCVDSTPSLIISQNLIFKNETVASGGGIHLEHASPTIDGNIIRLNVASGGSGTGGGIACAGSASLITNNVIFRNDAFDGGGLWCIGSATLLNNTIFGNSADNCGGGLWCSDLPGGVPVLTNSILWANSAPVDDQIHVAPGSLYPSITYCNIEGGWPGTGNILSEPFFADSAVGDFHLSWNSPCKDAGDNAAPGLGTADMEGDPRIAHGAIDLGADEFYVHLYVTGDVVPGGRIDLHVVGQPDKPVTLALGGNVIDPPHSTQHGSLHIWPVVNSWPIGAMPSPSGLLTRTITLPSTWSSGEEYPFQVLVGVWGGAYNLLSNLLVLEVD